MGLVIASYFLILLLLFGISYLIYWVLKRIGFRKTGIALSSTIATIFSLLLISTLFEDQLFFKRDALKLLDGHNIHLQDDFEIRNNKSMWAMGDSYHTFTLHISENDKNSIGTTIRHSVNFQNIVIPSPLITIAPDRHFGKRLTQNYETQSEFVRELFEPSGKKGYAPTYQIVKINKSSNRLVFEDIDE